MSVFDWAAPGFLLVAAGVTLRWCWFGPSRRTREQIRKAVEGRGLALVSARPRVEIRLGRSSRALIRVRARNAFGNLQTLYFDVDPFADLFSAQPSVRHLGSGLSPTRFVVADPD